MVDITHSFVAFFFVAVFGLIFGSFVNVVIYRLPIMEGRQWRSMALETLQEDAEEQKRRESRSAPGETPERAEEAVVLSDAALAELKKARADHEAARFSLVYPPSHCPGCHAPVKPLSNIPLVSFIVQRGKCKNCGRPISWQYPIVEFLAALGFVACYARWGMTIQTLCGALFTLILLAASGIDWQRKYLLDVLTLPLMWAGLLVNAYEIFTPLFNAVVGAAAGYMSLWLIFQLFKLVTGKEGMGYGDFKLVAALGAWLGYSMLPVVILLSAVLGVVGSLLVMKAKPNERVPFGPYLALAGWLCFAQSDQVNVLIDWWLAKSGFM